MIQSNSEASKCGRHETQNGLKVPNSGLSTPESKRSSGESGTLPGAEKSPAGPSRNIISAERGDAMAELISLLPEDLSSVVTAWEELPEAVRAGILAMVSASRGAT